MDRFTSEEDDYDDALCNEAMDEYETLCLNQSDDDDDGCNEALNNFESTDGQEGGSLENQTASKPSGRSFEFELFPHTDRRARKFGVHRRVFTTRLNPFVDLSKIPRPNLPGLITDALRRAISSQILNGRENGEDFLMINMSSNRLHHSYQSHRVRVREWNNQERPAERLLNKMKATINSNEQFELDDSFHLEVTHIRDPGRGSGRKRRQLKTLHIEQMMKTKKSVIYIDNEDDLCCARALVTIKAKRDNHPKYQTIQRGNRCGCKLQEKLAKELHREARVPEGPCGLREIELFQIVLSEYQIVVMSVDHGYQVIYKGPQKPEGKQLVLIKVGEHYHACNSISGFMGKVYYCLECEKAFDHDNVRRHPCKGKKCFACHQYNCDDYKIANGEHAHLPCRQCNRFFFGPICKMNHMLHTPEGKRVNSGENGKSVCDKHKQCVDCRKMYTEYEIRKKRHVCGYAQCPSCKEYLNLYRHECYLQNPDEIKERKKKNRKRKRDMGLTFLRANEENNDGEHEEEEDSPVPPCFVYFDIEARQDHGEHVPNLLCAEINQSDECEVFEGERCVEEFLDWIRSLTVTDDPDQERPVIAVAHNFQGYDSYFILDEFYKQGICPDQIVNGAKILSMSVGKLKFIDSMSFLQMPLSGFTKAFGLAELKKGFFPHFFNRLDHQDYVGPIPSQDYYDPKGMSAKRKKEFETWHKAGRNEHYQFNFHDELVAYCKSDVRLLKEGCEKFQREFELIGDFNPMATCITIASACNLYFRKKCLKRFTIASEPIRGWHGKSKTHSHAASEWLHWMEHQLNQSGGEDRIAHADNTGESRIQVGQSQIYVDGFDFQTQTVYEFNGCFYHGCPTCFPKRDAKHPKHDDMSMRQIYEKTLQRNRAIENAGYNLITIWECEWNHQKLTPEVKEFVEQLQLTKPLEPREAFFGGRTNAIHLCVDAKEGEEIRYVDYTSLYPWVNKNCTYPIGHPIIITQPRDNDIYNYFGLIKCRVIPPHELYHPVLPYRCKDKLTFPLCRTCVETQLDLPPLQRTKQCPHSTEERALTGTWCTPELYEALDQGYEIDKIHEIWHFKRQSRNLFVDYINTFLKMKQEASGWPDDVGDDPVKQAQYIEDYEREEGIRLDPNNIVKNPGRRQLAKMMLNSFWGKFGQQSNKCQVEAFTSPAKFYELISDDSKDIHSIRVVNEEMLEVVHNHQTECDPVQTNINIFVACFTTCWARLKLYDALKTLEPQQTKYFDTDSIIYSWKPGQPELPLGNYLGEFTNELDRGDHIVEFAAAGPKNYGYKTAQGKIECKVRGFRLNVRGQEQLNFDILKNNVKEELQHPQTETRQIPIWNPHKIVRDNKNKSLFTETEIKRYQLVFDKRVIDPDTYLSYPYGYSQHDMNEQDVNNVDCLMDL